MLSPLCTEKEWSEFQEYSMKDDRIHKKQLQKSAMLYPWKGNNDINHNSTQVQQHFNSKSMSVDTA